MKRVWKKRWSWKVGLSLYYSRGLRNVKQKKWYIRENRPKFEFRYEGGGIGFIKNNMIFWLSTCAVLWCAVKSYGFIKYFYDFLTFDLCCEVGDMDLSNIFIIFWLSARGAPVVYGFIKYFYDFLTLGLCFELWRMDLSNIFMIFWLSFFDLCRKVGGIWIYQIFLWFFDFRLVVRRWYMDLSNIFMIFWVSTRGAPVVYGFIKYFYDFLTLDLCFELWRMDLFIKYFYDFLTFVFRLVP